MNRKNFAGKVEVKRTQAAKRAEERAQRTPQQQLELLDKRLGKGVGASKERAKLQKQIEQIGA